MTTVADIVSIMKKAGICRGRLDSLAADQPLDEQGLDSFDRMSLLTELEDSFNVELPNDVARQLKTLNDIVNHLNQRN